MAITVTPSPLLPSSPHPGEDLSLHLGAAPVPVSATLAANETMNARRRRGEPVLPLGFGEAGLPTHRMLRAALARHDLDIAFDQVIATALARDPEDRFPSMRSLSRALTALVADRRSIDKRLSSVLRLETVRPAAARVVAA